MNVIVRASFEKWIGRKIYLEKTTIDFSSLQLILLFNKIEIGIDRKCSGSNKTRLKGLLMEIENKILPYTFSGKGNHNTIIW